MRPDNGRSSAYPSSSHRVIDVIPHLVYHIKNKYFEQSKALILDAVAAVTVCFKTREQRSSYSLVIYRNIRGAHIYIY